MVFEAGLFVGSLGKDRVFIVADSTQSLKIPSDYAGIMRATYDGVDTGQYSVSAVSLACNEIESSIRGISISPDLLRLRGRWKSRFASGPVRDHPVLIDDVEITAEIEGLQIAGTSQNMPYLGRATVHHGNQIIGHWTHPSDRSLARGAFMLTVGPTADVLYGYFSSQDSDGAPLFGTWVFAKADDRTEQQVLSNLLWAQGFLGQKTISPALEASKA